MKTILSLIVSTLLLFSPKSHATTSQNHIAPPSFMLRGNKLFISQMVDSIEPLIHQVRDGDILYFAATGDGKYAHEILSRLEKKKVSVYCIDISSDMLAKCKEKLKPFEDIPGLSLNYIHSDIKNVDKIAQKHPSPDHIFAMDCIHNIPKNSKIIEKLARVLKRPDSIVALTYPGSLYSQEEPFMEFIHMLVGVDSLQDIYLKKHPQARTQSRKKNKFFTVSIDLILERLRSEFSVKAEAITLSQTTTDFFQMVLEEEDYAHRFLARLENEHCIPFLNFAMTEILKQSRNTLRKVPTLSRYSLDTDVSRYWNVLFIQRNDYLSPMSHSQRVQIAS